MSSWPQCVGLSGEEAKQIVESNDSQLKVQILKEGTPVTKDLRRDRVRIFVDDDNIVKRVPRTG